MVFFTFSSASFSSSQVDFFNSVSFASWSNLVAWYWVTASIKNFINLYDFSREGIYQNVCVAFELSWYSDNTIFWLWLTSSISNDGRIGRSQIYYYNGYEDILLCTAWNRRYLNIWAITASVSNTGWSLSRYWIFFPSALVSSDCSSVESELLTCRSSLSGANSQLSSCQSSLSGANSSLSSCQSDLSSCTNSCDTLVSQCQSDKETLQSNYSGCLQDNNSLNNYNSSLNEQLNECLQNSNGSWSIITWFTLNEYSVFWSDWVNDYSLPITNNIFLPSWIKWVFSLDRVLSIIKDNSLDNAYYIDDEDFQNKVIGSFGTIFLFLMSLSLMLLFIYTIRKYFIWLKSVK